MADPLTCLALCGSPRQRTRLHIRDLLQSRAPWTRRLERGKAG